MRALARPYLQHGSRHGAKGSDPIPGLVGVSWIWGTDTAISVPSDASASTHYDFTTAVVNTNDASVFAIVPSVGLQINAVGFYLLTITCQWSLTSDVSKIAEMALNISGSGNEIYDAQPCLVGLSNSAVVTQASEAFPLESSGIGTAGDLQLRQNSGSTALVGLEFGLMRLTDDYGDF